MRARHVLSAIALLAVSGAGLACQLRLALEQWPPYLYRADGAAMPSGLDWELAQAILKEAGCTLKLLPELPTARRQREFEQGQLDLLLAASDTPARHAYARFSIAYRHESVGVFTRSAMRARYGHVVSLDVLSRERLPLLAPKVGWYGRDYARVQPTLETAGKLSTFSNFQQGLRMLQAGRADLILGDRAALRYEANMQGVAISALPLVVLRAPVHLMLNRSTTSEADLDRINAAITRLEHHGALSAIRARYGE
ncbi:substrate-binding periplasmic protein [Duganella callida]|uniref:Transporter substrate-binding domain-containing protein n=1 Tax=Duganella callida TaxID=2561932 RepID=A0A4Y9SVG9_9BURK|nr:transporter substrate-binding domain-containing protein [Duganella callida]TFW30428.1 transporter substrate-binding domain-containing protein [Duganella callida]